MPRGPDYQKERSERQQQRILELLAIRPMSAYDLSDRLHLARTNVHKHLNALMEKPNRRVRVATFELKVGRPRYVYALGNKPDLKMAAFQKQRIVDALKELDEPSTTYAIVDSIGMDRSNIKHYFQPLRKAKRIYIADWIWSDRTATPLYLAGQGEDAPRPRSMPVPEKLCIKPQGIFAALGI